MPSDKTYRAAELERASSAALQAVNLTAADADLVARTLVSADQRGIYSHGLLRLPLYVAAVEAGGITAQPNLTWVSEHGATALLDADSAFGQVAMRAAVERAHKLASEFGVATVVVRNSTHFGAAGWWTQMLTNVGLIGIVTSTTGSTVAPFGGHSSLLGTNPLAISMPSTEDHPLTADMATSAGAYGKVLAARNAGTSIPEGWAINSEGEPTTDPAEAIAGALVPFGGHKGSAVSVLIEALSASLSTANYAFETKDIWAHPDNRMNTGHLVIALDPAAFGDPAASAARVATLQQRVRATGPDVLAPGDPEYLLEQAAGDQVSVSESTATALDELFARLGVTPAAVVAE